MHDVHHKDGDVTQRAPSVPQVTEDMARETSLCCLQKGSLVFLTCASINAITDEVQT